MSNYRHWTTLLAMCTTCCASCAPAPAQHGMVVSPHAIASRIGVDVLRSGGNAVDAAVATGLALGVVDQFNSGIGGGVFLVIRMANGRTLAIDGRETAPTTATPASFRRDGVYDPALARVGVRAAGVPGAVAAYDTALRHFGTRSWRELTAPAVAVARSGFPLDAFYADKLASVADDLRRDPPSRAIYFHPDGTVFRAGNRLQQPDLADVYAGMADHGPGYFYLGPVAQRLVALMETQNGLITAADLRSYRARLRRPVTGRIVPRPGGPAYTLIGMPPPSSGGIHVIQILELLARLGPHHNAADLARAMGFAFYDRHRYLGDPDFVEVPTDALLHPAYLDALAVQIRQGAIPPHHISIDAPEERHTAGFVVIDRWGNTVAATATINTTFGAKRTIPGTGIVLNNQMDDFVTDLAGTNTYGLTGSAANLVAPHKRPLSSMAPTIVLQGPHVVMLVAAAGGPMIITGVAQVIDNVLTNGLPVDAAIKAPRLHHQWQPPAVFLEPAVPLWPRAQLSASGFALEAAPWQSKVQALVRQPDGRLFGASDPRAQGAALGY